MEYGFNDNTFAICVYHVLAYQISTLQIDFGDRLRVISRYPKFRFSVGEYTLACHKVGTSAADDIQECFPRPESAAGEMVPYYPDPRQLRLPSDDFDPGLELQRTLVLAHFGNPNDGMIKAYLCFPTRQSNGQVVEWGFTDPLVDAMPTSRPRVQPDSRDTAGPPEETIGDFDLRLKGDEDRRAG